MNICIFSYTGIFLFLEQIKALSSKAGNYVQHTRIILVYFSKSFSV